MKRATTFGAVGFLLFALVVPTVGESQDEAVAVWFSERAPTEVRAADAPWLSDVRLRGSLAFGDPVPLVGIRPPEFDLRRDVVVGDSSLEASVDRSGSEYCARATVDGAPAAMIACGEVSDGGGVALTSVGEVAFFDESSATLPGGGITQTQGGWLGIEQQQVVALDESAREWLGADQVVADDFVRALAKRKAEYDAVARIGGSTDGGPMPLFQVDAAWQKEVAEALAIGGEAAPDVVESEAGRGEAASDVADSVAGRGGWVTPSVVTVLLVGVAGAVGAVLLSAKRRLRRESPADAGTTNA